MPRASDEDLIGRTGVHLGEMCRDLEVMTKNLKRSGATEEADLLEIALTACRCSQMLIVMKVPTPANTKNVRWQF
jgi:hypothetical protein